MLKTLEETLFNNLVRLRKSKGFRSQEAFAEKANIPFPTYRDIERGRSWPERKNLAAIARTLGVPESHLFLDPDLAPKETFSSPGILELAQKIAEQAQEIERLKSASIQVEKTEVPSLRDPLLARVARLGPVGRRHLMHAIEAIEENEADEQQDRKRRKS